MSTNPYASDDANVCEMYLPMIDPAAWQGLPVPERQWAWEHWIPWKQATYLTGPGSAGKSLLGQQLATAVGLGVPFMGIGTRQATALYITCEDDADELHRRQVAICNAMGVSLSGMQGRLYLASLVGNPDNALFAPGESGELEATTTFRKLMTTISSGGVKFIVLDNVAHLFGGNENDRHHVAGFVNLLNRIAMKAGGAVLFIGHPNKSGQDYSGSTAWENQVRSRLFMTRPVDDDGNVLDPDARVLSRGKANYARNGETLSFRWHDWAFVQEGDLPPDQYAEIAANAQASGDNLAFLKCLAQRNKEQRQVSEKSGANYAPKIFSTMPEAKGIGKQRLTDAMDRLFRLGGIERGFLWRDTAEGKDIYGLRESGNATGNAPETRSDNDRKRAENDRKNTPIYTTYINGAPPADSGGTYSDDDHLKFGGVYSDDDLDWETAE